jgi:hypothetical protein
MKKFTEEEVSDLKVGVLTLVLGNVIVEVLRFVAQLIF